MYRLATVHNVRDRRTDYFPEVGQYHANSRSYCVQYDRLKKMGRAIF